MSEQEISDAVESDPAAIRLAAMNLLARREHSVRELRTRLQRNFPDATMIDEVLTRLIADRLQSDVRFAESYARQRMGRGYGPLRLREELRQRGVSEADVTVALDEMAVDWCAVAAEVMRKKFGTGDARDLKEKGKRARFMQYRGFSADHYQQLL